MLATFCCKRRHQTDKVGKAAQNTSSLWDPANRQIPKEVVTTSRRPNVRTNRRSENYERLNEARQSPNRDRKDVRFFIATNKEIISRSRAGSDSLRDYIWKLCNERQPLNDVNVATIFHSSAKHPSVLTSEVLDYLMDAMEHKKMDARALANTLYGLQGLKNSPAVSRVLRIMTANVEDSSEEFTPQQLGNALYGLRNMEASPEISRLLRALEPKLRMCKETFSVQGIASACFGMRSLCDSIEVRSIIQALAEKTEQLNDMRDTQHALLHVPGNLQKALHPHMVNKDFALDGWAIGNALYGLQNLGDTPEVRQLIGAIAVQVEKLDQPMKAQEVTISFYGLRSFRGSPPEIRRLIAALALQLRACTEILLPRHIASSLYGLRWLHESDEGKSVLVAMVDKTQQCVQPFDGQAVGNSLYGLQSFGNCKEMRGMLEALTPKVEKCRDVLTAQEIGNAFYGLRSTEDCTEVRRMLVALTPKLEQCAKMDPQAISNALFGLHSLGTLPQINDVLRALTPKIRQCHGVFSSQSIANAFSGLQTMDDSAITREVVRALTSKLAQCKEIKPEQLGNILINFRTLGDSNEVRAILKILQKNFEESTEVCQSQHLTTSLIGLSYLGNSNEVVGVLGALVPHLRRCKILSPREIANCLHSLRSLHDSKVARSFLNALAPKIDHCTSTSKALAPNIVPCSEPLTLTQLRRALQGVRCLGDSMEVQLVVQKLSDMASQWSLPLHGTGLESIHVDSKQASMKETRMEIPAKLHTP